MAVAWSNLDEARIKEPEKMADGFKENMAEVLKTGKTATQLKF